MLKLTGEYEHVIDEKNRLFISTKLRSKIDAKKYGSDFILALGPNGILGLYPEKCYEQLVAAAASQIDAPDEAVDFERMLFALSAPVEFDRQGRLLISEKLKQRANLGTQITVIGSRDHLEIWNTADWERHEAEKWPAYERQIVRARQGILQKQSQQIETIKDIPEE